MSEKPLLTIAIPAYNRPDNLESLLHLLQEQNTESIEIWISDDQSPDEGVGNVVRKFQQSMPNLLYNRNEENLGYSGNVCKLYELAATRYVWFLCDDDSVLPNAVNNVLDALDKYEPTIAIFNYTQVDPYGQKITVGPKEDILYTGITDLKDYHTLLRFAFLSIIVMEKSLPIDVIKQTNYRDNVYVQITLCLYLLSNRFKLCEISKLILHRNVGFKYGDFFKFILVDHLKSVFIINHIFDNKKFVELAKKDLLTDYKLYLSQKIGLIRYNQPPTNETIKAVFKYYGLFFGILIFAIVPISYLMPGILIRFIYFLQLCLMYGYKKGLETYKRLVNRAYLDPRKTLYTSYR
jgi:glycosyltransferase involved in cell wall biosynthesis